MTGTTRLESVRIRGFRSLADIELSGLGATTVLIGSNGSGKFNFMRFFEMLSWMVRSRALGEFVEKYGGADDQLFGGNGVTPRMEAEVALRTGAGRNDYRFSLAHAHPDRFMFTDEAFRFSRSDWLIEAPWNHLGSGHREAGIVEAAHSTDSSEFDPAAARVVVHLLRSCSVHQFHDTSDTSSFKKRWEAEDNGTLHAHGGNLAAVLHRLEQEDNRRFELICQHIARVLPVFDRFEVEKTYGRVLLRWKARGSEKTFGAHLTSDGSLRFFALVTLLNLPREMLPDVLLLDEPELGLHPVAIALVGNMIKALAGDVQIIVATQSPLLVDVFELDEIVVLDLRDGRSVLRRVDADTYRTWLDDSFTPGELWQKNLLGGRP